MKKKLTAAVFIIAIAAVSGCSENVSSGQAGASSSVTALESEPSIYSTEPVPGSEETTSVTDKNIPGSEQITSVNVETLSASVETTPKGGNADTENDIKVPAGIETNERTVTAEEKNIYYEQLNEKMHDVCDGLYYHAADDVKLAVLRCDDNYFVCSAEPDTTGGWISFYYENKDLLGLENGEFGFLTADVSFENGGEDGRMNYPGIDRFISFEKADLSQILGYDRFPSWTEGFSWRSNAVTYENSDDTYYIIPLGISHRIVNEKGVLSYEHYRKYFVFSEGKPVVGYDAERYDLEEVVKLLSGEKLITDGIESVRSAKDTVAVFRIGDAYYSFRTAQDMNRYPTLIYNDRLENALPDGYSLDDGDCAMISADVRYLNGSGYDNNIMIRNVRTFNYYEYDRFLERCTVLPICEYIEATDEYHAQDVMFDRNSGGTWLLFVIDGKYVLYIERYLDDFFIEHRFVGKYDTIEAARAVVDGNGGTL